MEMREHEGGSHSGSTDLTGGLKTCGTDDTPPCPIQAFHKARNELIYQLAGQHANRKRIEEVARQVDLYMIAALNGVRELTCATQFQHVPPR